MNELILINYYASESVGCELWVTSVKGNRQMTAGWMDEMNGWMKWIDGWVEE